MLSKTLIGILSIILLSSLIGFGVYVYVYCHTKKEMNLSQNQCITMPSSTNSDDCIVWSNTDQKCYLGEFNGLSCSPSARHPPEKWQINLLIVLGMSLLSMTIIYFYI